MLEITTKQAESMSDEELLAMAYAENPTLTYGQVEPGLNVWMERTRCINLWRNEECYECYLAGDPPRGTLQGFPLFAPSPEVAN